jgi:hypothetical protein
MADPTILISEDAQVGFLTLILSCVKKTLILSFIFMFSMFNKNYVKCYKVLSLYSGKENEL